jgi:hypothetical protein
MHRSLGSQIERSAFNKASKQAMANTNPALDNIFARNGDASVRIRAADGAAAQDFWLQAHSEIGLVTIENMEVTKAWKDGVDGKSGAIDKLVFKCKTMPETLAAVETECKRRGMVVSMKGRGKQFPVGKVLRDEIQSTEEDEYGLKLRVCKKPTKYAAAFRKAGRASFIDPSGTDWTERLLVKREDCADEFIDEFEGKKMKLMVKCYGVSRAMNFMWEIVSVRPMEQNESGNKRALDGGEVQALKKRIVELETKNNDHAMVFATFEAEVNKRIKTLEAAQKQQHYVPAAAAAAPAVTGKPGRLQPVSS